MTAKTLPDPEPHDRGGWRVPPNTGRRYPAETLLPEEVQALLRACSTRAPTGLRNRALLVAMYRGGLRVGEALALLPKDVDPVHGTLRITNGKGGKARLVGRDPEAMAVLERWLDRRAQASGRSVSARLESEDTAAAEAAAGDGTPEGETLH